MLNPAVEFHPVSFGLDLLVDSLILQCFLYSDFLDHLPKLFVLIKDFLKGTLGLCGGIVVGVVDAATGVFGVDDASIEL